MKPPAAGAAPPSAPGTEASTSPLHQGLAAYGAALGGCGGRQHRALPDRPADRGLRAALYSSPPYALRAPALSVPRLSITLTAANVHGAIEGDRPRQWRTARHALFLTPAGAGAAWTKAAPSRHINLYFDAKAIESEDTDTGRGLAITPVLNLRLPGLAALAERLAAELEQPQGWAAEAADSLGRLILVQLARHHAAAARTRALPPPMLGRLREYIRAHLGQRLRVEDLAKVAGLTPNRFAHAYARSTGTPPHRAVVQERVAQALRLLQHGSMPLSEVALVCGFASQQHLSRVLRQHTGRTPSQWRRGAGA
jgi:AraC family transcriptional regulator